jgi:hypothetical protein
MVLFGSLLDQFVSSFARANVLSIYILNEINIFIVLY